MLTFLTSLCRSSLCVAGVQLIMPILAGGEKGWSRQRRQQLRVGFFQCNTSTPTYANLVLKNGLLWAAARYLATELLQPVCMRDYKTVEV